MVPFSGRSRMVSKELAVGLTGFPLCFLNLPVFIFLGGTSWKPVRRFSTCLYPNDSDANYCQACGT